MKLIKLIENEFKLHDTRTQTPPKQPHFDEIVIKFKFKLIENKSVVLSWVYLQPFCSTFFTFFTLFLIFISGATKTRQPSSRVFFCLTSFLKSSVGLALLASKSKPASARISRLRIPWATSGLSRTRPALQPGAFWRFRSF